MVINNGNFKNIIVKLSVVVFLLMIHQHIKPKEVHAAKLT